MNTKLHAADPAADIPLCVDVDGTLISTDLLYESVFALLKRNFLAILFFPRWLARGKAYFKQQIADRVDLEVDLLPFNEAFLGYLKEEKARGRTLILATAANVKFAEQLMSHLGIFSGVVASNADVNVSGHRKRQILVDRYGENGFDYAGNARVDLEIWTHARKAILVNPEPGVKREAERRFDIAELFDSNRSLLQPMIQAVRLHQWLKNLLVFVPLLMSHQILDPRLFGQALLAFLAFGFCASSVYLLNDLLDLPSDRRHPRKRNRPLASGTLAIKQGVLLIPILLATSFAIAWLLPSGYLWVLIVYYLMTLAYSFRLKQVALVDVLVLAGLYTMRIIAGAAATQVMPSFWLLAFSMFLFYSLALVKRYSELLPQQTGNTKVAGRGYWPVDLEGLAQAGLASGFLAVLVLALYVNSDQVASIYAYPEGIWLLCPILLYWINRIWLLTRRGEMHEDPVVFAIRDHRSHWLVLIGGLVLWASI